MWLWKEMLSLLIIVTTVQANLICPEIKDCKCQKISQDNIEVGCPEYDNGVNIKLSSGKSAKINHLEIYNCSLPGNKSFAELLRIINIDKVSELEIFGSRLGKFQSNHFYGLNNLIKLKINCPDNKNVPKDLFNQLHQLTHLNLSSNFITELHDETFWEIINLLCLDLLSFNQLTNITSKNIK